MEHTMGMGYYERHVLSHNSKLGVALSARPRKGHPRNADKLHLHGLAVHRQVADPFHLPR